MDIDDETPDEFIKNLPSQTVSKEMKKFLDEQTKRCSSQTSIRTVVANVTIENNNTEMKSKMLKNIVYLTESDSKNGKLIKKLLDLNFIPVKESKQCYILKGEYCFSEQFKDSFQELPVFSVEKATDYVLYFVKQKQMSKINIVIEPNPEFEVPMTVIVRDLRYKDYVPGQDVGIVYNFLLVLEHNENQYTIFCPVHHRPSKKIDGKRTACKRTTDLEYYECANKNGTGKIFKCQSKGHINHSDITSKWLMDNIGKQIPFTINFPLHLPTCKKNGTKYDWLPNIATNKRIPLPNQMYLALRFDAWYDAYSFTKPGGKSTPVTVDDVAKLDRDMDVFGTEEPKPFVLANFFKSGSHSEPQ